MRHRVPDLVGLQRADQVQFELGKLPAQLRKFLQRLLHPVFAEDALPGGERGAHRRFRMGLADRDEAHRVGRAAGGLRSRCDAAAHRAQIGRDEFRIRRLFHNGSIPGTKQPMTRRREAARRVFAMSAPYYRLLRTAAASLSLLAIVLTAGCGSEPVREARDPITGRLPAPPPTQAAIEDPQHTDATLFTVLGLATPESERNVGPLTGNTVSPVLWEAARDTLGFAGFSSEDPMTGLLVTNWYSPPAKRGERLRVSVFILSRALRSDSLSVTVDRQVGSPTGQWADAPVSTETVTDLEAAILLRARQIHAERYRSTYYK